MNPLKYNPLKSSFSSEHIHESEVKSFVNEWLRNVNEENLSAIVNMYSRNAILLPTLSSEICVGREEIQRYFVQFLGKEELQGRFTKLYVQILDDTALASGEGVISYRNNRQKNSREVKVDFRYTFAIQKGTEGWHIINHHSSLVP